MLMVLPMAGRSELHKALELVELLVGKLDILKVSHLGV